MASLKSNFVYHAMRLCWAIDDLSPFWTPFGWLGDRLEDYGLKHKLIHLNVTFRLLGAKTREDVMEMMEQEGD